MRNLLAFLSALTLTFFGLGWYLGWYKIQTSIPQDGHQSINVDVNNKKIKEDILRAEQRLPHDITALTWLGDRLIAGLADGRMLILHAPAER